MNEKTFAQIIGEELRNLRKSQGWTQGELAQKASNLLPDDEIIRQNDISSFENTGGTLSLNKIHAAFSVLGKNLTISEKKNYVDVRVDTEELRHFEYLLDHPETPIVSENGAFRKLKEQFHRLLSIPERAANNMVDEELRARAACENERQQANNDGQLEHC